MLDYDIKIKKFEIKNFRLFKDLKVDFNNDSFNSFIGRNATGKTAMLEALNICLSENSSKFNSIKEDNFYSDESIELKLEFNNYFFFIYQEGNFKRLLPCKKFTKIITKREQGQGVFSSKFVIKQSFELKKFVRLSPSEYKKKWQNYFQFLSDQSFIVWSVEKFADNYGEGYYYTVKTDVETKRPIRLHEFENLEKFLYPQVFYFDKDRDRELIAQYNTVFSNIVDELDWRYKHALVKTCAKENIIKKYDDLHSEISSLSDRKKTLLTPAVKLLKKDFKIGFNIDDLDFYFLNYDQPFQNSVFGHRTSNKKIISIQKSGSGISILVALSLLVSFAKQSKSSIIILIDEPELHLHSDLQKNLHNFLKKQGFQTFIATHSHLFLDKESFENNFSFQINSDNQVIIEPCNQITLSNTSFGLLGNSLDDLYVPENLILVEGKYDKQILTKCLCLLNQPNKSHLILDCGGDSEIPNKGDLLEEFFEKYCDKSKWYGKYISERFKIIVDGNVKLKRVDGWKQKYNLQDNQLRHLSKYSLEYLYPESLIKQLVTGKTIKDGSRLDQKNKHEIVQIILEDEKKRSKSDKKIDTEQNLDQIISKQRLTEFVAENLTLEILEVKESKELKKIVQWIIEDTFKS